MIFPPEVNSKRSGFPATVLLPRNNFPTINEIEQDSKMQQEMASSVLKHQNDFANKVVQQASSATHVLTQPTQPITPHPRLPSAPLMPSAPNPNRHQYVVDTVTGIPSRPLQPFCNLAEWITTSSGIPKEVELSRDLGVFAPLWILLTKQPGFQERLPKSSPTDDFSPPSITPRSQHLPLHQPEFNEPPSHVGNSPEPPDIEQLFLFDLDPTSNADTMFEKIKEDLVGKGSPPAEKFSACFLVISPLLICCTHDTQMAIIPTTCLIPASQPRAPKLIS